MPCIAISASRLAAGRGATVGRVSVVAVASGSEKPEEPVRFVLDEGVPRVVPFGP